MERQKLELFHTLRKPEVREVTREDGSAVAHFRGYALVWDEWSVVMYDKKKKKYFREMIQRGAFDMSIFSLCDCVCTCQHDDLNIQARRNADGTGSMRMSVDEVGLAVEFEFANSPAGMDAAERVRRGDFVGMSFTMYEGSYTYTDAKGADGIIERTITKIDYIDEVTIAGHPAYPATTAESREAWATLVNEDDPDAEAKKREAEEQAAKEEAERKAAEEAAQREAEEKAAREKFTRERTLRECQASIDTALL